MDYYESACEIHGWLQNAVGDAADSMIAFPFCQDEEWEEKIRDAKFRGVTDLSGWLADEMYDDDDTVMDMVGDRLYDSAKQDADRIKVALALKEMGHDAIKKACDDFIERRS